MLLECDVFSGRKLFQSYVVYAVRIPVMKWLLKSTGDVFSTKILKLCNVQVMVTFF